ncbi:MULTISPECIES: hypothetical protein [Leptolyngbya]|jgi:hypothetical protein|uniref:Uncharacterized protein n=2 Tax=Leptolyngbya boryana TaxID=1184 RepID=A0A1Z4JEC8_LEPBY|nr:MULTISPECIES: hypothetical protein [Leptolyngbya]BAY55101.1 hypothetical protein NIES2135_19220 [Leptolyngbya boryana NIES-2135]MBD1855396.1 hypothetical protein [Leptolyngbya sp. FACHB-1624]MBD2366082.1 hypothetical protein [Leptolyngbya sp. FACHB-161]MBD2372262.1 hypothetical protein [Leptolyngbya sp. FACHB-238]MBD2396685.1 hypothetical protein [Leptolyngbya sp. FACHB-239]
MSVPKVVVDVVDYFSGAFGRIFGLRDDQYPESGVQPFSGDVYDRKHAKKDFER